VAKIAGDMKVASGCETVPCLKFMSCRLLQRSNPKLVRFSMTTAPRTLVRLNAGCTKDRRGCWEGQGPAPAVFGVEDEEEEATHKRMALYDYLT